MLHYKSLEWLVRDKHFDLLGTFVSYEENKCLWKRPQFHIQLIELFWKCEKIIFLEKV